MDESDKGKLLPPEGQHDHLESTDERPRPAGGTMDSSWRDRGFHRDEGSMIGLPEENKKPEELKVPAVITPKKAA